jgi:hypothetical protein
MSIKDITEDNFNNIDENIYVLLILTVITKNSLNIMTAIIWILE